MIKNRVVITESVEQSKDFVRLLNRQQADVIVFPLIKIVSIPISGVTKEIFNDLTRYDWIFFTSPNSVRYFFYILMNQFIKFPMDGPKLACCGNKTCNTLRSYGRKAEIELDDADVTGEFRDCLITAGIDPEKSILFPVSKNRLPALQEKTANFPHAELLAVYSIQPNTFINSDLKDKLINSAGTIITFWHREAVQEFIRLFPVLPLQSNWKLVVSHPVLADKLQMAGLPVAAVAAGDNAESMVEAVLSVAG